MLLAFAALWSARAGVREVGPVGITVGNLDRALAFYTEILSFEKLSEFTSAPGAADDRLGLSGTHLRSVELRLGKERLTLTEHLLNKGRSIPADSRSFDLWFQHAAIVVSDMDKAYQHLRRHRVRHVSTAPQTLPAWNPDAGGIRAFYFRDPEDHVLEIIWFPPDKGDRRWQRSTTNLFLGIDHTAMVVSDTRQSLGFYRDLLGLRVAGGAENYGVEQEHLNQVFGARLRITSLRGEHGPGLELLEYLAPPGGRPLPADSQANDLVFWHTRLIVAERAVMEGNLRGHNVRFVSRKSVPPGTPIMVRDPDGHALEILESAAPRVVSER